MKKLLLLLLCVPLFGLGQVVTCVPCDQLGMSMNVGSQETAIMILYYFHERAWFASNFGVVKSTN